ncbi:hypothetical protein [Lentibacillus songyuanensis]|uniref:hypothetical protein n=1 Tax=Lentibacillus songyuanensis TaxID=3136161 RepID=UPI0031BB13C9
MEEYVPFDVFLNKLKQEYEYHKGGSSYRLQTAKLALDTALKEKKATPFLKPEKSRKIVSIHYPFLDKHRKDDVTKMLWMVAKSMYLEHTTPDEVKEYVKKKSQNKIVLK